MAAPGRAAEIFLSVQLMTAQTLSNGGRETLPPHAFTPLKSFLLFFGFKRCVVDDNDADHIIIIYRDKQVCVCARVPAGNIHGNEEKRKETKEPKSFLSGEKHESNRREGKEGRYFAHWTS